MDVLSSHKQTLFKIKKHMQDSSPPRPGLDAPVLIFLSVYLQEFVEGQ